MDKSISNINRKVKHLEKHLEVIIHYQDEEVPTVFERFENYSHEEADLVLYSKDKAKRYKLNYNFSNGILKDVKSDTQIEITDLFSNRHLRSILYAGREAIISQDKNIADSFSIFFRKIDKREQNSDIPVMSIEHAGCQKRWFMISTIHIMTPTQIEMEGLLSIVVGDYFMLPVNAKCKYNIKSDRYTWSYTKDGKGNTESFKGGHPYSTGSVNFCDILYAYTEYLLCNESDDIISSKYPEQTLLCRKIFKNQKIMLYSKNPNFTFLSAIFYDIKSISENEIVFRVCDGNSLLTEISYDRRKCQIRKQRNSFQFIGDPKTSGEPQFTKAIKLLAKY